MGLVYRMCREQASQQLSRWMNVTNSPKTTPAIRRATQSLKASLTQLQTHDLCDLQQRVQGNCLNPEQQLALAEVLHNLYCLAQAESLRNTGGRQQDMFSHLDKADFAAWARPMNQRTLFQYPQP